MLIIPYTQHIHSIQTSEEEDTLESNLQPLNYHGVYCSTDNKLYNYAYSDYIVGYVHGCY